jgi:hypothetical protein
MFKWAATFIFNRVIFLAVVILVLNTYARTTCSPGGDNLFSRLEQSLSSLKDVARALQ